MGGLKNKKESLYEQGVCIVCGHNKQQSSGICKKTGNKKYKSTCTTCSLKKIDKINHINKENCDECGFTPKHPCQLDIDHIDGNHKNNDNTNLRVICANCHRLKTFLNNDWSNKRY